MAYINDKLTVSDDHRAVINSYGFELRSAGGKGLLALSDPLLGARKVGGNLQDLLQKAVEERHARDNAENASDDHTTTLNGDRDMDTMHDADAIHASQERVGNDVLSSDDLYPRVSDANVSGALKPWPLADVLDEEGEPEEFVSGEIHWIDPADLPDEPEDEDLPEVVLSDEDVAEIEDEAVEEPAVEPVAPTENVKKVRTRRGHRKDTRYVRAAREIVKNPAITPEQLAKACDFSNSTANHCLDAWEGVVQVLREHDLLANAEQDAQA